MSIEQPVDPQLIEQTKRQIRALVAEIAQLSKTEVSPDEFYSQFLPRVISALAAVGGAVWTVNPEGRLALQYQVNLQETRLRESEEHQVQHAKLLYKVLKSNEGILVPPYSGPGDLTRTDEDVPAANPTEFLLVFGLLKTDLETVGLIEIFQRSDANPDTQKGYLRFLSQMCELAADYLKSHQLRHFSDRQTLWTQLEDFTRNVHVSLDPRATSYTIANEGRRLIECDRVSVAIRKGRKCYVEAVSGQDLFDKRSNTVRLLGKLASAVVASGDAVWYTGDTRDMAPQVEDAVQEYVDDAHSKTVAILPLRRPAGEEEDDPSKRSELEAPIGALIIEQIEDSRVSQSLIQRAEVVCQHSSAALANALEHQNLFLMPVWRTLGKMRWVVEARTLPKTLTIAGLVVALIVFLAVWPAKFTLESKGSLEPTKRRDVFAGVDGIVQELFVAHGDLVKKDQPLAKLRNTEIEVALTDVLGQRLATKEKLEAARRTITDERNLRIEERNRLMGEVAELKQKLASLDAQLSLQKAKQAELLVRSPIDGEVTTWDLRNRLINRPVQRGQVLLRVADPAQLWHLELHMPEHRMGHIMRAQQKSNQEMRAQLQQLWSEEAQQKQPETAKEQIEQSVQAKVAQVADEDLHRTILEVYQPRLRAQLQQLAGEVSDPTLRAKLTAAMNEKTYGQTMAALLFLEQTLREAETPKPQEAVVAPAGSESADAVKAEQPAETVDAQKPAPVVDNNLLAKLEAITQERLPDHRLEVSYILATEPSVTHYGRIYEIHRSAEVRGDEGNTVLIKIELEKSEMQTLREQQKLRPGATVTAKVDCGLQPLGYVFLHDLFDFIQSRIIFKFF